MDKQAIFEDTLEQTADWAHYPTKKILTTFRGDGSGIARILLTTDDSLGAAAKLRSKYPRSSILVLNFANNDHFCDRKFDGSTQEEDIARRTNLYHFMNDELYPICRNDGPEFLMSHSVSVVKDADGSVIDRFFVDILSAAAIVNPRQVHLKVDPMDDMAYDYMYAGDRDKMLLKLRSIVNYAGATYDFFVAGAWGMGAFNNPEYGLIKLWNRVLAETPTSKPLTVVFPIPSMVPGKNYTMDCFKKYLVRKS